MSSSLSISRGLSGRHNALGFIRLLLAAAVIVSHAFPLSGRGEDPFQIWSLGQDNLGGVAVLGFFAISGFLITKSGTRNDVLQYLWARILRIFPAYFLVLIVASGIVGPIAWIAAGNNLGSYVTLGHGGPVSYLTANWSLELGQWGIHDIFATTTPYGLLVGGSVFNGSLWTLAHEWFCYLVIGALVLFGIVTRARVIIPVITLVVFVLQVLRLFAPEALHTVIPWLGDPNRVKLLLIFLIGACLAAYSDRILLDWRIGLFCVVVAVATYFLGGFSLLGYPAFAYALLWLAASFPERLKRIGSKNDYSYGLYLYGFLVEQLLASFGLYRYGFAIYLLAALVVSWICAWLSWHLVEKNALKLKSLGPGRGLAYWWRRARSIRRTA